MTSIQNPLTSDTYQSPKIDSIKFEVESVIAASQLENFIDDALFEQW